MAKVPTYPDLMQRKSGATSRTPSTRDAQKNKSKKERWGEALLEMTTWWHPQGVSTSRVATPPAVAWHKYGDPSASSVTETPPHAALSTLLADPLPLHMPMSAIVAILTLLGSLLVIAIFRPAFVIAPPPNAWSLGTPSLSRTGIACGCMALIAVGLFEAGLKRGGTP